MDIRHKVGILYFLFILYFIINIGYKKFVKKEISTLSTKVDTGNEKTNILLQKSVDTSFSIIDFIKKSFVSLLGIITFYFLLQYLQTNDTFNYDTSISSLKNILLGLLSIGIIILQLNIEYPYESDIIKFLLYIPSFIMISYIISLNTKKDKHNSRIIFGYILIFFYICMYVFTNIIDLESNNFIVQIFSVIYIVISISIVRERFTEKESYSSLKYILGSIIVFLFMVTQFIIKRIYLCDDNNKETTRYDLPRTMYILFIIMFGLSMLVQSTIFCALRAKPETLQNNKLLYWIIKYRVIALYALFILIGVFSSGLAAIQCKGGLSENPPWTNNYLRFLRYSSWFHVLLGNFKSSSIFLLLLYGTLPSCIKKECKKDKDGKEIQEKQCDTEENKYVYKKTNVLLIVNMIVGIVYFIKYIIHKVQK